MGMQLVQDVSSTIFDLWIFILRMQCRSQKVDKIQLNFEAHF